MDVSYEVHWNDDGFVVVRVKPYRRDIVAVFASEAEAKREIQFQESLDRDKIRDRCGR